jgi:hypothetical protein
MQYVGISGKIHKAEYIKNSQMKCTAILVITAGPAKA